MIGTIRWNLWIGAFGFILTFLTSHSHNVLSTTMVRGLYGFLFMFGFSFLLRWLLGTVAGLNQLYPVDEASEDRVGSAVDLVTPPEGDSMQDLIRQNLGRPGETAAAEEDFAPLHPPKLISSLKEEKPEDLVKAVRHLTEE